MSDKKEESKTPLTDMMQESTVRSFVEGALPAVLPMLKPLSEKLDGYLGNDEKIIIIRRNSDKSTASVLVLDTSKNFTIKGGKEKKFSMDAIKDGDGNIKAVPVIYYFNTEEFVTELLSGKFTQDQGK